MKKILTVKKILILCIFCVYACSDIKRTGKENLQNKDLKKYIGKNITVTGQTVNMKLGAILITDNGENIWMDGMDSWPEGYYVNDNNLKTVKVTGTIIEKNDLPVFIPNENDPVLQQGIPEPKGTDLEEASHRYLLKDYTYSIVK